LKINVIKLADQVVSREELSLRRSMVSRIFSSWLYWFNGSFSATFEAVSWNNIPMTPLAFDSSAWVKLIW
jgi:hypothetical protein